MNRVLFALIAIYMSIFATSPAKAEVDGPIWTCSMAANAAGQSFHFVIGRTYYSGDGHLRCVNLLGGDTGSIPIHVAYSVWGLGLGFSEIDFVHLLSVGVRVADPNDIFGKYGVANLIGASVLAGGFAVDMVAQLDKDGVGLDLGIVGRSVRGLEVTALNFGSVRISRHDDKDPGQGPGQDPGQDEPGQDPGQR